MNIEHRDECVFPPRAWVPATATSNMAATCRICDDEANGIFRISIILVEKKKRNASKAFK